MPVDNFACLELNEFEYGQHPRPMVWLEAMEDWDLNHNLALHQTEAEGDADGEANHKSVGSGTTSNVRSYSIPPVARHNQIWRYIKF